MSEQRPPEPTPPPAGSATKGPRAAAPLDAAAYQAADPGTPPPPYASSHTEPQALLFDLPASPAAGAVQALPPFDAAELLARQFAEIDAPVELTEAEIAALPLSSDEPPDPDLSETPWWLTDEFHGSDAAEQAAWLASLPADIRAAYENGPWDGTGEVFAAGFLHHDPGDGPAGPGFIADGWADTALPGPALAAAAADASTRRAELGESELIGLLCAWQRLTSWTQAGQVACLNTLIKRRKEQSVELNRPSLAAHVDDEAAAALALTGRAASRLLDISAGLARLPEVAAALSAGRIDWAKASLFTDLLAGLPDEVAVDIAGLVLAADDVTRKTTGQLRAALAHAIAAYDPEAAQRRRDEARKDASVQSWAEPSGNAALAGRELSPADVVHASAQLTADALWFAECGLPGSIDELRALAFTTRLTGRPLSSLLPAGASEHVSQPASTSATGDTTGRDSAATDTPATDTPATDTPATDAAATDTGTGATDTSNSDGAGCTGPGCSENANTAPGGASPDPGNGPAADSGRSATPDRNGLGPGTSGSRHVSADNSADRAQSLATSAGGSPDPGGASAAAGHSCGSAEGGPLGGTINLTMPLSAWAGLSNVPGELAGYGPADAATCRDLAARTGPGTRWCLTLTGSDGRAVAHACTSHPPDPAGADSHGNKCPDDPGPVIRWATDLGCKMQFLESGPCTHARRSAGYRPPPSLAHLLRIRQRTCSYPGCRRPARRCDLDHVVPYDLGGATCECNLTPLCRRHHQAKQAPRWHLSQSEPGALTWQLPHGRSYAVKPGPYPV
jgi:hypothetical protein